MEIVKFIYDNAYIVLALASIIPSFFWLKEFKDDLRIKNLWQIVIYLACVYLLDLAAAIAGAELQNLVRGYHSSNRSGLFIFIMVPPIYLIAAKLTKRDLKVTSDVLFVQTLIAFGFGKTACYFQGCCIGTYIPGTNLRWPIRIIELLLVFAFVFVAGKKAFDRRFSGKTYPVFLIVYGAARPFLEISREMSIPPVYNVTFYGCVICIILGVFLLLSLHILSKNQLKQGGKT